MPSHDWHCKEDAPVKRRSELTFAACAALWVSQGRESSLAAPLTDGGGETSGFRVHASAHALWVQIGLWPPDLPLLPTSFFLNPAGGGSAVGIPADTEAVITGLLAVGDGTTSFGNAATGLIFDAGATATIQARRRTFAAALTRGGPVFSGPSMQISAPSLKQSGLGSRSPLRSSVPVRRHPEPGLGQG